MRIRTVLFAILALFAASQACRASGTFYSTVSLDTTGLEGLASFLGPFWVTFEFADGSGTLDGNNAVVVSGFEFGGGSPVPSPWIPSGGVGISGSLDSGTVYMIDDDPFGFFAQQFWPGTTLSFRLRSTTNVDACPPPAIGCTYDQFTFGIMDSSFNYIPTTAGDGTDLLSLTLDDPVTPTVLTFGTDPDFWPFEALGPPLVSPTPEPATWLPAGLMILGGAFSRRRWRARP